MPTEKQVDYEQRIKNWKRAAVLFMSIAVMLVVAIAVVAGVNDKNHVDMEINNRQIEEIEELKAENALLEERIFADGLIMALDMLTVDSWSILKRKGDGYEIFLKKGSVSVWATKENLQETIDWLNNIPDTEE